MKKILFALLLIPSLASAQALHSATRFTKTRANATAACNSANASCLYQYTDGSLHYSNVGSGITDFQIAAGAGSGTVTSVACGSGMSCSPSPITGSGTISIASTVPMCTPTTTGDYCGWNGTNWTREPAPTGGSGGYSTIDQSGTPLTQRSTVNFTGAGVSCVDNSGASRTDCTISGGGSGTLASTYSATTPADNLMSEAAGGEGVVFKGYLGQITPLASFQVSSGSPIATVTPSGTFTGSAYYDLNGNTGINTNGGGDLLCKASGSQVLQLSSSTTAPSISSGLAVYLPTATTPTIAPPSGGTLNLTGAVKVNGDLPVVQDGPYALSFPGATSQQQISVGKFYQAGRPLPSVFYWDFWAKPQDSGSRYAVIESASGAHALELGFNQVGAGTVNTPFGLINTSPTGSTLVQIGGDDGLLNGEWGHYAVFCDGTYLYSSIDGILSGQVSWSGIRQTYNSVNNATGTITIGGTDHNNFNGELGGYVRGWEGYDPLSGGVAFIPERFATNNAWQFSTTTFTPANLLIPLTNVGASYFPDLSPIGYNGTSPIGALGAPTITNAGTSGSVAYSYKVVPMLGENEGAASASGSTATGNATLDGTNYNTITWVANPRATSYQVFRSASSGSPSNTGLIGTVGANVVSFNDAGISAVNVDVPTADLTSAGRLHPGSVNGANNGFGSVNSGFPTGLETTYPMPNWVFDSSAPFSRTTAPVAQSGFVPSPSPIPVGARIFDDFERADQTYAFQASPTLGSTVAGASLGSLAWATHLFPALGGGAVTWGILHGAAHFLGLSPEQGMAVVNNSAADMDVRINRRIGSYNLISHVQVGIIGRFVDTGNFWYAYVYGTPAASTVRIGHFVSGVQNFYQDYTAPAGTSWTRLRVTWSGTTATVYTGVPTGGSDGNGFPLYTWTQAGQVTGDSADSTGTYAGLAMDDPTNGSGATTLAAYDNFEVQ